MEKLTPPWEKLTEGKVQATEGKAHRGKSSDHRGKSSGADFGRAQRADERFAEKAGESSRDAALGRWQGIINALDICARLERVERVDLGVFALARALHNHAIASALAGADKGVLTRQHLFGL